MTRRRFLALVALATVSVGAGALTGWDRIARNFGHLERLEGVGRHPRQRLRRHYAWLHVSEEAVGQYVADHERIYGRLGRFSIVRPDFYTRFLLSTDFFGPDRQHASGEPVRYVRLYEPLLGGCYNPLAQPPPTAEELSEGAPTSLPT